MPDQPPIAVGLVGVAGAGIAWDALADLAGGRVRVTAIYDTVRLKAKRAVAAATRPPAVVGSVTKLAEVPGLRAAVVTDPGWSGLWAARNLCEHELPVLWLAEWPACWDFRGAANDLLIPGLRLRYLPATIRLRERIATDLGAVQSVHVESDGPTWEAIDWAAWVSASRPVRGTMRRADGILVPLRSGVDATIVRGERLTAVVECENGVARMDRETLAVEGTVDAKAVGRPAVAGLLDLFCRRTVGGLVPVPSVDEVRAAITAGEPTGE